MAVVTVAITGINRPIFCKHGKTGACPGKTSISSQTVLIHGAGFQESRRCATVKIYSFVKIYKVNLPSKFAVSTLVLAATLAAATPSHALIQTVSGGTFNTTGTDINSNPIVFPPFSAESPGKLLGARIKLTNTKFEGSYDVIKFINTGFPATTYSLKVSGTPNFVFSGTVGSSSGTPAQSLLPSPLTLICPNQGPNTCADTYALAPSSQPFTGTFVQLDAATAALQNYFSGTPTIISSQALYTLTQTPSSPSLAFDPAALSFSGEIFLEYEYVPGPLPLLGVGTAFGWSRRLRKRIAKGG